MYRRTSRHTAAFLVFCLTAGSSQAITLGDAKRGEALYQDQCKTCHSLDKNEIGPKHRGVFGRAAASVQGFQYSPALVNAHIVWNEETLDKWLTDAQAFVPDSQMFYTVDDTKERADIIAFLKEKAK